MVGGWDRWTGGAGETGGTGGTGGTVGQVLIVFKVPTPTEWEPS